MLELPEALTIARQINETIGGKRISHVVVAYSPHKFTWYHGDPQNYANLLSGKRIDKAIALGGFVEIKAETAIILINDGVGLRYHSDNGPRPKKHQLLIEFDDLSGLSASVQMYGGICCFPEGEFDNVYYEAAQEKPSPLSNDFDQAYFSQMIAKPEVQKLSAKAFLATEQRIPGLGNGVLQDILYNAKIHPKRKINVLSDQNKADIFNSIKDTLAEMTSLGGRDTEKDIYGHPGGYRTRLSKNTVGKTCPLCNSEIKKETYLGGSIYYCDGCQTM